MGAQAGGGDGRGGGPRGGTGEAAPRRTNRLREVEGTVCHIRNGEIARIGNKSQGWARALLDVPLDLSTDIGQARELALSVAQSIADDPAFVGKVVEPPEVWGLESIGADGLVLRVTMKTAPLEQWPVERELRERLMVAFLREGILLGVPQRAVRNLDAT